MKKLPILFAVTVFLLTACRQTRNSAPAGPATTVAAVVAVSGDKQEGSVGSLLEQPLVIQTNDAQGNAVANVPVRFSSSPKAEFDPQYGVTDSGGQFSTAIHLGVSGGPYIIEVSAGRGTAVYRVAATGTALGYRESAGRELVQKYCSRCHNPESSPLQVSNFDNLDPKPHEFADGQTLNLVSDRDLTAIITRGGRASGKSAQMPAYGATLKPAEIASIAAYIRAVAVPPYQPSGVGHDNR